MVWAGLVMTVSGFAVVSITLLIGPIGLATGMTDIVRGRIIVPALAVSMLGKSGSNTRIINIH